MTKHTRKNHLMVIVTVICAAIALTAIIVLARLSGNETADCQNRVHAVRIDQGNITLSDGTVIHRQLPTTISTRDPFTLTLELPETLDVSDKSLAVFSSYAAFSCVVDDVEIYRYQPEERTILRSGGSVLRIFILPEQIKSRNVNIHFSPANQAIDTYKVSPVDLGRHGHIVGDHFVYSDIWNYIVILILIMIFIFTGLVCVLGKRHRILTIRITYIGLLCLGISLYLLVQLWTFNYVFSQFSLGIYALEFYVLMFIPIPVLAFIRGQLNPRFDPLIRAVIILMLGNVLIQTLLALLGVFEYKQMLILSHILILVGSVVLLLDFALSNGLKYPNKKSLLISFLPVLFSVIPTMLGYWIGGRLNMQTYLLVGVVVFILIQLYQGQAVFVALRVDMEKNRIYKDMAFLDSLTGLDNRSAYTAFLAELGQQPRAFWIVLADMNNLKKANDLYGHAFGDRMLVQLADLLRNKTKELSGARLFRTGGDEFMMFLFEPADFAIESWIDSIHDQTRQVQYENDVQLSCAMGFARFSPDQGQTMDQAIHMADRMMYAQKPNHNGFHTSRVHVAPHECS